VLRSLLATYAQFPLVEVWSALGPLVLPNGFEATRHV
jgi:hypothetical protein